jgi:hypothetical protein
MITVSGNTSKTRRFQQQFPPAYLGENLDFNYSLSLYSPGKNLIFGLKSSDGTVRSQYTLKSGLVFDYQDRFITTYQSGENRFDYGLKKELIFNLGEEDYYSYQKFNGRLISSEDLYSGYTGKPFDRFFIQNLGSENVNFDLSINGFAPPTEYSNLIGIGENLFSGNLTQSGLSSYPSQSVPYGLLGVSIAASDGSVKSFQTSGSGGVHYIISGNNIFSNQSVNVEFDTLFGRISKTLIATTGTSTIGGESDSGVYLSLYGPSNLVQTNSSLEFEIDYYSNYDSQMILELETASSFATSNLSGTGAGILNYSGNVRGSGSIYSVPNITGVANLGGGNAIFNTQYSLVDTTINISAAAASRTTGVFFTGVNSFTITGVNIIGLYDGPYPGYANYYFSGLADVIATHEYLESDEGIYNFNETCYGYLNSGYSPYFYIDKSINFTNGGVQVSAYNAALLPTGIGAGKVIALKTGEGIVTREASIPWFFGEGTGRTYTSRVEIYGSGTGDVSFVGNAYDWSSAAVTLPFTPDPIEWEGANCDLTSTTAKGWISNGITGFYGTGAPLAEYQTWGFPTGPSNIVIAPMMLEYYENLAVDIVGGYSSSGGAVNPITFGFTGRVVGYINFPGVTMQGPVFPSPDDTGIYPYVGNGIIATNWNSYYGRGCIFSSGSSDNGSETFGLYVLKGTDTPFEVEYSIESGGYFGTYAGTCDRAFIPLPIISPAIRQVVGTEETITYNTVSLEFPDPAINRTSSGLFYGYGYVPSGDISSKFNLYYSENDEDYGISYKTEGWFSPTKFIRPTAYNYLAGFKKGYVKVDYTSADTDSSDEVTLSVKAGGKTGEVNILTNQFTT